MVGGAQGEEPLQRPSVCPCPSVCPSAATHTPPEEQSHGQGRGFKGWALSAQGSQPHNEWEKIF